MEQATITVEWTDGSRATWFMDDLTADEASAIMVTHFDEPDSIKA